MTNVDRRDEIERELQTLDSREEEIEHRLHELSSSPVLISGPVTVEDYSGEAGEPKLNEWDSLVAEQISLITRRHSLYSEFSALISAQR